MLKISNVHKTFNPNTINEKKALNGVDLVLNEGDFVTVIGGNGAGKSTMLNMIAGVYPVDCGTITVDGIDVTKLPEHKRAKYIGRVFQDPMNGTAADMQILENLALAKRRGQHMQYFEPRRHQAFPFQQPMQVLQAHKESYRFFRNNQSIHR